MSIYISPGVYVREKDLSTIIPNLSTTIGALVGYSAKGTVGDYQLITNSKQFIDEYGEPSPGQYFHYSALAFLEKGNKLYCVRVVNGALYGGAFFIKDGGAGVNTALIVGVTTPAYQVDSGNDILFYVFAKDPGAWNNNISIAITNINAVAYTFDIEVYATSGGVTSLEETWSVSRKQQLDGFGRQQYLETKINGYSAYINVYDNVDEVDTVLPDENTTPLALGGGADGNTTVTEGQIETGWDLFAIPEDVDIRMLINGGYTSFAVQNKMKTIAEARADCIAILDMPYAALTSTTAMTTWRTQTQMFNSSYCALYSPWVKIYDQFNDTVVIVPPSGYVAAQYAYNDYVGEPWNAPAGLNRGLLNILGLTNVFTEGERDVLYAAQINPIQTFRGEGNMIWGQKTEKSSASALDRVNVRRLLITLEKAIAVALRTYAFEPNTAITRMRVSAVLEQYLDLLSARGAFQKELGDKGYVVICNSTNNTPATIDDNELNVDIYIKPVRAAEYIRLQAIITQTGASFEELVARGVNF